MERKARNEGGGELVTALHISPGLPQTKRIKSTTFKSECWLPCRLNSSRPPTPPQASQGRAAFDRNGAFANPIWDCLGNHCSGVSLNSEVQDMVFSGENRLLCHRHSHREGNWDACGNHSFLHCQVEMLKRVLFTCRCLLGSSKGWSSLRHTTWPGHLYHWSFWVFGLWSFLKPLKK